MNWGENLGYGWFEKNKEAATIGLRIGDDIKENIQINKI
jgi:hypothetical protein